MGLGEFEIWDLGGDGEMGEYGEGEKGARERGERMGREGEKVGSGCVLRKLE